MKKKELYEAVIRHFQQAMPVAETELHYENPFQLLVAVILSAQCTDKRINQVTPRLFEGTSPLYSFMSICAMPTRWRALLFG